LACSSRQQRKQANETAKQSADTPEMIGGTLNPKDAAKPSARNTRLPPTIAFQCSVAPHKKVHASFRIDVSSGIVRA
jgi:hypothetical protein